MAQVGKQSWNLRLGGCSSRAEALFKIHSWAPAKARSWSLEGIRRYHYAFAPIHRDSFSVLVRYHPDNTGDYRLGPEKFDWNRHLCGKERYPVLRTTKTKT